MVSLPQNDTAAQKAARKKELVKTRAEYVYNHKYLKGIPMLQEVPHSEGFTTGYNIENAAIVANVVASLFEMRLEIWDKFNALSDYGDFFRLLRNPAVEDIWRKDWCFARQRTAGVNPVTLQRVKSVAAARKLIPEANAKLFTKVFGSGDSFAERIRAGHLYAVDYSNLADVPTGLTAAGDQKYLPAPTAFFVWDHSGSDDRGELRPFVISYPVANLPTPHISTPVSNLADWSVAKLYVQIADGNIHEMQSHLFATHLSMEPFAIATPRQLSDEHPVYALLRPHLRFILAKNEDARKRLIDPGGFVDNLLGGTLKGSISLVLDAHEKWNFYEAGLPRDLKNRGVEDVSKLPDYPYRDDGMLLWGQIEEYVTAYVDLYYQSNRDVTRDTELQAWVAELVNPEEGTVRNLSASGDVIRTRSDLVGVLTQIIFTCGPQHAAVNFAQWDFMAYVANIPFSTCKPVAPPGADESATEALWSHLPHLKISSKQVLLMGALALFQYDELGDYCFDDPQAQDVLGQFRRKLDDAEREIRRRNKSRPLDYKYLRPSKVPNSISI